jgi:hypothetical protein
VRLAAIQISGARLTGIRLSGGDVAELLRAAGAPPHEE